MILYLRASDAQGKSQITLLEAKKTSAAICDCDLRLSQKIQVLKIQC